MELHHAEKKGECQVGSTQEPDYQKSQRHGKKCSFSLSIAGSH